MVDEGNGTYQESGQQRRSPEGQQPRQSSQVPAASYGQQMPNASHTQVQPTRVVGERDAAASQVTQEVPGRERIRRVPVPGQQQTQARQQVPQQSFGAQSGGAVPVPGQTAANDQRASYAAHASASQGNVPVAHHAASRAQGSPMRTFVIPAIVGALAAVLAVVVLMATGVLKVKGSSSSGTAAQTINVETTDEDVAVSEAVAAKAVPSVVSIIVETSSGQALGSGVIYDTDGNIITNYHVVEDANALSVTIDGTTYDATVVGSDSSSDIAVIHVDLNGASVTPIEKGDSDELVVGDWVMTIGSPFGLDQSVSQGIVSALSRSSLLSSSSGSGSAIYTNLIQVDAAINQGNSGGALVNDRGQLVGISTLLESSSGDFSGIAFAIPGNYAMQLADKIIAGEEITHAYLGVSVQTVTSTSAQQYKLGASSGAYVAEVTSGSPADEAGIQQGDVITKIGDTTISSADEVILAVRSHEVGETVSVTYVRGGSEATTDVTLSEDTALQEQQSQSQNSNSNRQYDPYDMFGGR